MTNYIISLVSAYIDKWPLLFDKKNISTTILVSLSIIVYLFQSLIGFTLAYGGPEPHDTCFYIISSLFYSFSHVNIFHLLINIFALIQFRPRISTALVSYPIAVAIGLLSVSPTPIPTCGISVLLYASIARYYVAWNKPIYRPLLSNVFLCGINFLLTVTIYNWLAHIIAFSVAYLFWFFIYRYRLR